MQAVIIRYHGHQRTSGLPRWSSTTIPAHHPVSGNHPASRLSPKDPHRHTPRGHEVHRMCGSHNQTLTYLNIELQSRYAPMPWQSGIGSVIVARKDRKPFLPQHLEGLFEYASGILDRFGDGDGPPLELYNWQAFERWWKNHAATRREGQAKPGQVRDPDDDWTAVKSPYEV